MVFPLPVHHLMMYHQLIMTQLIAVANLKGGCGKSTIAVNLACAMACHRHTVVLVDADAQGTATYWLSHGSLPIRGEAMPLDDAREAQRWVTRVLGIAADYVLLDTPPHVGAATEAVVGVADVVVVPVTASAADLTATVAALGLIAKARRVRADGGPPCLMVPSKIDRRTAGGREIEAALKPFGEPIGPTIHQRVAFVEALSAGQWVGTYAPDTSAHHDIMTLARAVKRILTR
jgi:chromosome partitioning protein